MQSCNRLSGNSIQAAKSSYFKGRSASANKRARAQINEREYMPYVAYGIPADVLFALYALECNTKKSIKEQELSNIYSRIKLSEYDKMDGNKLVTLKTGDVEKIFSEDKDYYISPNGQNSPQLYKEFEKYLQTGKEIDAPTIKIIDYPEGYSFGFIDGRHRFAVLRDLGMEEIPFAIDKESLNAAKKYGLLGF